jgi:hypothetical protein
LRGTPRSTAPPLRSTIEPAAITTAPARRNSSITSRVLPPVVTTSSTTTTRWFPGLTLKTAAQSHGAVLAFGEDCRNAQRPPHFMTDDDAAHGRRNDQADGLARAEAPQLRGASSRPRAGGVRRILQHPRALQIFGTVEPAGQAGSGLSGKPRFVRRGLERHRVSQSQSATITLCVRAEPDEFYERQRVPTGLSHKKSTD